MTSLTFKKFQEFVNEELDQFYEEAETDNKNYKIPVDLKTKDYEYKGSTFSASKAKKPDSVTKIKKTWIKPGTTKNLF